MTWSLDEFERLVSNKDSGGARSTVGFLQKKSSLSGLMSLLRSKPAALPTPAPFVLKEVRSIPLDKRQKYSAALEYLIWNYPYLVDELPSTQPNILPTEFGRNYSPKCGHLVYGIHPGRMLQIYYRSTLMFCDDFNNHFGIGKGQAFKAAKGMSSVAAVAAVKGYVANELPSRNETSDEALLRVAYYDCLMGSKYAPDSVFSMREAQLRAEDKIIGRKRMPRNLLEMQHSKAIRRACKNGIKMVASMPQFTLAKAKIHFILDCMGDLGDVAQKKPLKNNEGYVSITSSEVAFCFRYWSDPQLKLSQCVYFYVNGHRVPAPWEDVWYKKDGNGKVVSSNYPMWQRYGLKRELIKGKS